MKRILKILSVIWLVTVTPLFGVFPLWCLVNKGARSGIVCHLEMAILDDVWVAFIPRTDWAWMSGHL